MIYNLKKHRYVLEKTDVEEELAINLDEFLDSDNIISFLNKVTRDVYVHIDKETPRLIPIQRAYLLSRDKNKEIIKEALLAQVMHLIIEKKDSGSELYKDYGQHAVGYDVHMLLYNAGLLFRGKYQELNNFDTSGYGVDW